MKRSLYSFISLVLAFIILTAPVQAETTEKLIPPEPLPPPHAPSWIKPEEYVIHKDDEIYQKYYNWRDILEQREYAQNGGTKVTDHLQGLLGLGVYDGWKGSSLFFELGLIGEKLWENGGSGSFMAEAFDSARENKDEFLFEKVYGYEPSSYMARVWYLRADYAAHGVLSPPMMANYMAVNRPDLSEDPDVLDVIEYLQPWYDLLSYPEFDRKQVMDFNSVQWYTNTPGYSDI